MSLSAGAVRNDPGSARRIVWFVPRPLYPERGGGDIRSSGLVQATLAAGHEVLLVQPGPLGDAKTPPGLRVIEVPVRKGVGLAVTKVVSRSPLRSARLTRAGRRAAEQEIREFGADLMIVSELLSWPVAQHVAGNGAPWIFDDHNVETQLYREFAEHATTAFDRVTFAIDRRRIARLEPVLVAAASALAVVSDDDARSLARLAVPQRGPVVVPSSVPTPDDPGPLTSEPVLLFVGSLNHPPNIEALRELVQVILPRVSEAVPGARLVVAGRNPTAELRAMLRTAKGVELREGLPDLGSAYREARCTVMPIRTGSGSRLKVYEALAHGLPAVGTSRAFAGVDLEDAAITAESASDLAANAVSLLSDDKLAQSLRIKARTRFLERLSWEHASRPLLQLIDELS